MIRKKLRKIRNFFKLYTSGLSRDKIEVLLKKDTIEAFSYLKAKTNLPDEKQDTPLSGRSVLLVAKEIFISFIMQLTPARRFFYGIGLVCLVFGLINMALTYIILSVVTLNFLLALELVDKLTTRDELEIAREIQMGLQPLFVPDLKLLSFATFSKPAKLVGGDFFDIVQPDENRVLSIVGDVSDKGISAALYAAYAQSMFQSLAETRTSPIQIMGMLNDLISRRLREGDFITVVIALFDLEERSVSITRAGHNWPLYYDSAAQDITEIKPKGVSIGLVENTDFTDGLEEYKIFLKKGDFILLYTDGVTEAVNPQNRMFDISSLKTAIEESAHESSNKIIDHINLRLKSFIKSDDLQDDATMVAIKIKDDLP